MVLFGSVALVDGACRSGEPLGFGLEPDGLLGCDDPAVRLPVVAVSSLTGEVGLIMIHIRNDHRWSMVS